jgi:hypothetical protein
LAQALGAQVVTNHGDYGCKQVTRMIIGHNEMIGGEDPLQIR